jgi:Domain of unknown function (DUF4136)
MRQTYGTPLQGVVVAITLSVIAGGARAQSVQSDFDRAFDFSKLKTFAFAQQQRGPNDPLAANPLNDRRIRTALDSQLVAHGYTSDSGGPDFLVAYHAATRARTSLDAWGYGPGRWRGGRVDVNQYTEGTLIVDMVDPASKQLVWRGTATGTIQLKDVDKKIREAAKKLTERFVKDVTPKGK